MTTHPMVAEIGHWARCSNCNEPIHEEWDPSACLCPKCALDNELWDREGRMERYERMEKLALNERGGRRSP
jgi:hypothetical protein